MDLVTIHCYIYFTQSVIYLIIDNRYTVNSLIYMHRLHTQDPIRIAQSGLVGEGRIVWVSCRRPSSPKKILVAQTFSAIFVHLKKNTYIHIYIYIYIYIHEFYMHIHTYIYVYIHTYIYIYIHIHIYIYIYNSMLSQKNQIISLF